MIAQRLTGPYLAALFLILQGFADIGLARQDYVYEYKSSRYPYFVEQTGDNYTFEFDQNPGPDSGKRRAAMHVFQSVYGDYSIKPMYVDAFMKEGATCYVFDANMYTYRVCFLPNDFSATNPHRFWGFVSRLPNAMWFLTWNILPLVAGSVGLWWFFRRQEKHRAALAQRGV